MTIDETGQSLPAENSPEAEGTAYYSLENAYQDCVQADSIKLSQCGVGRIDASEARVSDSGVSQVYAENAALRDSMVGFVQANSVELTGGGAGMIVSQAASVANSRNGVVISQEVHGNQVIAVLLLANKVEGPVETLIDQRGLALIGIVAGAVIGMVFSLFRLFRRR
jgi:hypothetical protein